MSENILKLSELLREFTSAKLDCSKVDKSPGVADLKKEILCVAIFLQSYGAIAYFCDKN